MIGRGFSLRHTLLIARFSARHALRTGAGIIYLMIALGFCLYSADAMLRIASIEEVGVLLEGPAAADAGESGESSAGTGKVDAMLKMARPIVEWALKEPTFGDAEEARAADDRAGEWAEFLLTERPAFLSALFIFLLFGMPFVIPFGAFNQTSGDIGTKGLRYMLLRTERVNVFLGRYLGTAAFLVVVQILAIFLVVTFVAFSDDTYKTADLVTWGLHGALALATLTLAYVALGALLSACTDTPMASLVLLKVCIGGVLLAALILRNVAWEELNYLKWLLPWGVQNQLIAPEMGRVCLAGLACVGYALVFLFLGCKRFEARDL